MDLASSVKDSTDAVHFYGGSISENTKKVYPFLNILYSTLTLWMHLQGCLTQLYCLGRPVWLVTLFNFGELTVDIICIKR